MSLHKTINDSGYTFFKYASDNDLLPIFPAYEIVNFSQQFLYTFYA